MGRSGAAARDSALRCGAVALTEFVPRRVSG